MSLSNRVALITGASSDLGLATALEFARNGIEGLILTYYKNKDKIDSIIDDLKDHGCKVMVDKVDVSSIDDISRLKDTIHSRFDKVDIIVAYAGYPAERALWYADPLELDDDMLNKPWNVDLKGSYNCIKAFAMDMKKNGYGRIILTSSTPALYGDSIGLAFTLAKAAIIALTRSLANILAPEVCINTLALGNIATEANLKNYSKEEVAKISSNIPLRRFGKPEEVAKVARFLASDDSSYITGKTIIIDGGEIKF